jgi:hypothetical protein
MIAAVEHGDMHGSLQGLAAVQMQSHARQMCKGTHLSPPSPDASIAPGGGHASCVRDVRCLLCEQVMILMFGMFC